MDHHPAVVDIQQQLQEGQMVHLSLIVRNIMEENRIYFPSKKLRIIPASGEEVYNTDRLFG
jgi:hypothetical protein